MSNIRPELRSVPRSELSVTYESAYFRIMQAVARRRGLIHGRLHNGGRSCAVGCAFDDGVKVLPTEVIDEVATYNDSFPKLTAHERWKKVMAWLRFRTAAMKAKGSR